MSLCLKFDGNAERHIFCSYFLLFAPDHFVDDGDVGLDDFDDDVADVFAGVDVDGGAVVVVAVHGDGGLDGLQEALFIDAGQDEAGVVERLGAFGRGADADGREGMADGGEEARFLGQRAGVGYYGGGVHLQAVVVVEAEGLVSDYAGVEFESALLQALAAARMAAIEDGHVVARGDGVDGVEEAQEVFLGVDVFLAVGAQQDVFAFFEAEAGVDVAGLDVGQILVEHFGHGRAGDVGALPGQPAVGQVAAGVLGVAEVYVGDYVDDAAVGLFGQALVLAAVAGFHVEDGYVEAFGGDGAQAGIGVAEDEECVGPDGGHQLVGAVDYVADGGAEVVADGVHVYFGVGELEVAEEHAVEVVVVVLACVGQDYVEVLAALVDGRRQADDLRPRTDDYQQLELAVVFEFYVVVVSFHIRLVLLWSTGPIVLPFSCL